jgi:2-methylcitrate dehydratase PrpD
MARSSSVHRLEVSPAGPQAAERLANYASALRFEQVPAFAIERAKHCLIDAIGCAYFGRRFPWSQMVLDEAVATGAGGPCLLPGVPDQRLHVPQAALALGAFSHAFELDSLSKPSMGIHPGATVALPALAMAQAVNANGRDLITAIVAGFEVMFRVGAATHHSPEVIGFHAPGLTGPFGSATACAVLMRLSPREITNAYGIAGSLAGGLLAFAKSGSGGMIKRLHLGRAAEGGVLAARLAQRGYEGPPSVLEGRFGLLEAFCDDCDPALLTAGIGQVYEIARICIKRYGCHVTAQAPVQLLRGWIEEHGFAGDDIVSIALEGSHKVMSHHNNSDPGDIMQAQYSVPFCVAVSAYHDPSDPAVFSEQTIAEARVRNLAKRIRVTTSDQTTGWATRMQVVLRDGRTFDGALDAFLGCPEKPFTSDGLRAKFDKLVQGGSDKLKATLFDDLMRIDELPSLEKLVLS